MSRKGIIIFAVLAILAVMAGAMMHEAFEGPDTTPFFVDPDFVLFSVGALLGLCLSLILTALQTLLLTLFVGFAGAIQIRDSEFSYSSVIADEYLLFSPPRGFLPLRV